MRLIFLFLGLLFLPILASAGIVINEIAWMGTEVSYSDEWIELYNDSSRDVDLSEWILSIQDKKDIELSGSISAGSYFLIERTDDDSVPSIVADLVFSFGTGLSNTSAVLILKNNSNEIIDTVNAGEGWSAGDNSTKETMQKSDLSWVTGLGTPRSQNIGVSDSGEESNSEESSDPIWPEYVPPEGRPGITSYAGKNKTLVVGVLGEFRAEAFGLEKEPLVGARYLWNFGDGVTKEGQNLTHSYRYPGEYSVFLNVSLGNYSSSDALVVKVIPNEIFISEVKNGIDSFIELYNDSEEEINVSGWRLRQKAQTFTFAKNSFIRPRGYLVISISSSGIFLPSNFGLVELLYPGGFLANNFEYNGFLKEKESFSRKKSTSDVYIAQETPGEENVDVQYVEVRLPEEVGLQQVDSVKSSTIEVQPPYIDADTDQLEEVEPLQANIIATTDIDKEDSNKTIYYFLGVLGLALFASIGVFAIHRNRSV